MSRPTVVRSALDDLADQLVDVRCGVRDWLSGKDKELAYVLECVERCESIVRSTLDHIDEAP